MITFLAAFLGALLGSAIAHGLSLVSLAGKLIASVQQAVAPFVQDSDTRDNQ